jgi:hypothetical protein
MSVDIYLHNLEAHVNMTHEEMDQHYLFILYNFQTMSAEPDWNMEYQEDFT